MKQTLIHSTRAQILAVMAEEMGRHDLAGEELADGWSLAPHGDIDDAPDAAARLGTGTAHSTRISA